MHPSLYFQQQRHKATWIHLHVVFGAASAVTAQGASVHPPAPTPNPELTLQNIRTSSEVVHYGLSFSCCFLLLFNLTDLLLKLSSKTTREKTCEVMRLSVSHTSQPHRVMQEGIGMGSLRNRESLPVFGHFFLLTGCFSKTK